MATRETASSSFDVFSGIWAIRTVIFCARLTVRCVLTASVLKPHPDCEPNLHSVMPAGRIARTDSTSPIRNSRPTINSSHTAETPYLSQILFASFGTSAVVLARLSACIPAELARRAGFTMSGGDKFITRSSFGGNSTNRGTLRPASCNSRLDLGLSLESAMPSGPEPVYGTPITSKEPAKAASSGWAE